VSTLPVGEASSNRPSGPPQVEKSKYHRRIQVQRVRAGTPAVTLVEEVAPGIAEVVGLDQSSRVRLLR